MRALSTVSGIFLLTLMALPSAMAGLSRESGAIYLEDFVSPDRGAFLRVAHPAPIFYQLDGKRRLGTLKVGFDAEIIAISDRAYMVRAKAAHADVSGWVTPKAFEAHNGEDFVRILQELYERQLIIEDLVAQKKVALGMTAHEVKRSLGEPDRVESTLDTTGSKVSYEFIIYERSAKIVTRVDSQGIPYQDTVIIKVPIGSTKVEIEGDSVVRVSKTEGAPDLNAGVTISAPPILFF